MPSAPELRSLGLNALACRLSRDGGWVKWAKRLDLERRQSETVRGQAWEEYVADVLRSAGHQVQRQTTKAPYDLLVNSSVRINVKSARWSEYGACKGHFFGLGASWKKCDAFALVKVDGSTTPQVLWVPSHELKQQTLTLTVRNQFNGYTKINVVLKQVGCAA